ncbi:MAG: hypothetical protein ACI4JM_11300 [Oscillospiraceae bacterium]
MVARYDLLEILWFLFCELRSHKLFLEKFDKKLCEQLKGRGFAPAPLEVSPSADGDKGFAP